MGGQLHAGVSCARVDRSDDGIREVFTLERFCELRSVYSQSAFKSCQVTFFNIVCNKIFVG